MDLIRIYIDRGRAWLYCVFLLIRVGTVVMKYLSLCVEQLDLSVKQLHFNDPSYDRFSLILTDNIVELILHKQCERLISYDDMWKTIQKQKYPDIERKKVLGGYFKEKTKFCKNENLISEEEQIFINNCHKHRNVLYHVGIKYNDIIHSLALLYHQIGCELFKRLKPDGFLHPSPKTEYSEAVERHIKPSKVGIDMHKAIKDACSSLSKNRPDLPKPFPQVLSNSALNALEDLENGLTFLVDDNPNKMNEEQIIFHVQLWDYLQDKDTVEEALKMSGVKYENFFRAREYLEQNWNAPIKNNPIPRWKGRAEKLKAETNNFVCMAKYETLRNDMSDFERAVDKAGFALDSQIQLDIDAALGK